MPISHTVLYYRRACQDFAQEYVEQRDTYTLKVNIPKALDITHLFEK